MLNTFLDWGNKRCTELVRYGYDASLSSCEESSNTAAVLDIGTENAMARITAWNNGDVYLEVINIASEQTIYSKQLCLSTPFEFDVEFQGFFDALGFGSNTDNSAVSKRSP